MIFRTPKPEKRTVALNRQLSDLGIAFHVNISDLLWEPPPGQDGEVVRYLGQLVEEGYASDAGSSVHLPWPQLYALLDAEEHVSSVALLSLPPASPVIPSLVCRGAVSDSGFAIGLEWATGSGQRHTGVDRWGGALRVEGTDYLLSPQAYALSEAIVKFARRPSEERNRAANEKAWGRIRSLAQAAGARLDAFLARTIILTPEHLDLALRRITIEGTEVVEVIPEVEGAPTDRWLASFDGFRTIQQHYDLPLADGSMVRVVPDDKVREVLAEIKQSMPERRIAGQRARAFLRNPYAHLGSAVIDVIPPERFEAARLAAGVASIYFNVVVLREETGLVSSVTLALFTDCLEIAAPADIKLGTKEQVTEFADTLSEALARSATSLDWKNLTLDLAGNAADQLKEIEAAFVNSSRPR